MDVTKGKIPYAVICVIIVYAALSPFVMENLFLFLPVRIKEYPVKLLELAKEVSFAGPRGQLSGLLAVRPHAQYLAIIHHGQGGNVATNIGLLKMMTATGCSALIYDYSGFGKSTGKTSHPTDLVEDGLAATRYAMKLGYQPDQIVHCGVSLGTGVAAGVASKVPCQAVVLMAPYTSLRKVARTVMPWLHLYPDAMFDQDIGALDLVEHKRATPVLLIHADQDRLIPVAESIELKRRARCPAELIIYSNASHGGFSINKAASDMREFLSKAHTL